ncbi:hypothetical protein [Kibdelosporangium aridum]|uniref:hypothetical protein n=1 Tax=Kibdelosporangium aridum TaxID=2030 RepID=UPI001357F52D|nr:hypothetical protein [Kibdelosporangium aridum]
MRGRARGDAEQVNPACLDVDDERQRGEHRPISPGHARSRIHALRHDDLVLQRPYFRV